MIELIANCAFGLEAIVKRELIALGYEAAITRPGRIEFTGQWSDICKTNIWLRVADRIQIKALQFEAADFDALFETVKAFDWSRFLAVDSAIPVLGRSRSSQLSSVPAIQRSVKRAIVESLKREFGAVELPESGPLKRIEVTLLDNLATVTIDTTGNSLHRRGYRKLTGSAPIKETLAAAMVDLSVWNPDRMLVDPFCGTGTIPIEAALIGLNIAPGLDREFASSRWAEIDPEIWQDIRSDARSVICHDRELQISGTDIDEKVLEMARFHARAAGVEKRIHFQQKAFADFRSKRQYGVLVTNPPYGQRMARQSDLESLYRSFPGVLQRVPTWSFFFITSTPGIERIMQKPATRRRKLFNGRIECTYYQYPGPRPPRSPIVTDVVEAASEPVVDQNNERQPDNQSNPVAVEQTAALPVPAPPVAAPPVAAPPVFGELHEKDQEQALLFRQRLVKRARHLRRWPSRRGITCFRIYERDIPEIPLVVDRYEDHLHITEYQRPHDRDLGRHARWLELMKKTAAAALDISISRTCLKSCDRDERQYEKIDKRKKRVTVHEGGLNFLVNLTDYVDTGLFLDHRQTREMVRRDSDGKRFLNLFGYTGSFTVYAAAGGAKTTTTVDLSKNYLQWAEDNMQANQFVGPHHRYVAADAMEFLNDAAESRQQFDLCVVDPPTYSNSKRTDSDWDVQSCHVELLGLLVRTIAPGGVVYFSTNFRRFKFDLESISGYESIREISNQTVPEDFRNQRIHRCWRLTKLGEDHSEPAG